MSNSDSDAKKGCLISIIAWPLMIIIGGGLFAVIEEARSFLWGIFPIIIVVLYLILWLIGGFKDK